MTARIFCKDLRLAAHPMMYVFALFGAMLLIPSYPYTVAFFYGLLGIFFTFLNGRENKDVYYCAVLPVTKREQVRARTWMVVAVELTELVLAVPFAILSVHINPNGTNLAGIDANVALFGAVLLIFGVFNAVFLPAFYKTAVRVGRSFLRARRHSRCCRGWHSGGRQKTTSASICDGGLAGTRKICYCEKWLLRAAFHFCFYPGGICMKNKRLWLSVALTVLVVVCAMLILSRVNEARSNAVPTAPTDLILPPDIRTTAAPTQKTYDDLPDVDISSWEYLIASQAHNISDYVPDVSKISGSQSTFDSRAVDALNALLKAARSAGWSPYIYCAYRPYLTQKQQYEDQVSAYMREGDTRDEAETAAARVAAPPGTSDHQTGLGADVVDQYYDSLSVDKVNARFLSWLADNCADYGFVIRYPSDKVSITGRNEPWHVRYVGETAAKFMTEHNLCLEEFAALYQ